MSRTSSTPLCQIGRATAAWAIVVSLACLHGRAGEAEEGPLKRPAAPDSNARKSSPDSAQDPKLRQELLSRMAEDQEARKKWLRLIDHPQRSKDAEEQIKLAMTELRDVDRKNLARMKEIVNRSGWPGKSLVGSDASDAAWLLVQHADSELAFQKRCLVLIVAAVRKGESPPKHMAYLTDRVRVAEGKKQVYGTQFHDVGGRQELCPVENEADLDRKRGEVGLPPMADYRELIDKMYNRKS
jgi:hypothetical protein